MISKILRRFLGYKKEDKIECKDLEDYYTNHSKYTFEPGQPDFSPQCVSSSQREWH